MLERPAEFTESSDLLDDPAGLAARLREDGYIFFRGLLDRDDVLSVRADMLETLGREGWLREGSDPVDALPSELLRREADENWFGGYAAIQSREVFHRFAHDATIVKLVEALLGGEPVLVHPRKIARISYPNTGLRTPPHQDFPLIQGTPDVITAWVPFGDFDVPMGPLRVLQGSHRDGLQVHGPTSGIGGIGVEADVDDPRWRVTDYRAGDLLLFFAFTVHYAPPNEGDKLRLSADYRYQSANEDVVNGSLHPHGHPLIPDWDVLADGWSSTAWVETPPNPVLVDIRIPDASITAGASRFT
jgi:hypothetical protein